ncbi:CDP-Glycerol:Poly(glycerophosphate) glycerophosphotransferase [compost metagenome]
MPSTLRVLFLLQRPEAWGNVAALWAQMRTDPRFEPVAWLLPYNYSDPGLSAARADIHRLLLESEGIPFVEWVPRMGIRSGQFDVAVFTHPYDRERPPLLWFHQVRHSVDRIVYIPYGLTVGAGAKNLRLQFAQPLQIGADLIVARAPSEKSMYARYCPRADGHVQVLGHPRFDRMLQARQGPLDTGLRERIGGRVAFLWNSHFSFGHRYSQSSNFSTFDLLGPEIFEYFLARRASLCLIWRPHPGLFPVLLEQGLLSAEQVPTLRDELRAQGIVLDESPGHLDAFACSDAMISDPGSFLFDYLAMQRPMLALLNPEGEPLNEEATALVNASGGAWTMSQVRAFLDAVVDGQVDAEVLAQRKARFLPYADGCSASRICAAIMHGAMVGDTAAAAIESVPYATPAAAPFPCTPAATTCPLTPVLINAPLSPVLTQLLAGLRRIRAEKAAETQARKTLRRVINRVRTMVGEHVKQHPAVMAVLTCMRVRRT